jgi:predicted PolB exonuclease-like 3'-5' exonuclease
MPIATATATVKYLCFDTESAADAALVAKLRFPQESLDPAEAVRRYRAELMAKFESDFIPYTFQVPISVAIAKIAADFRLLDLVVLDEPQFRPHVITDHFWRGWDRYKRPTLVSFNGRGFDLPLLELAAFRYGVSVPGWFGQYQKSYDQPRNRYNTAAHLDLHEMLTNFGCTRFVGGLNLAANLLGKPGKMDVQGYMVQDMYEGGKLAEINGYCRCDVLDTYFVFLRTRVIVGELTLDDEQRIILEAKDWIRGQAETVPAYRDYLSKWGDWKNPWKANDQ